MSSTDRCYFLSFFFFTKKTKKTNCCHKNTVRSLGLEHHDRLLFVQALWGHAKRPYTTACEKFAGFFSSRINKLVAWQRAKRKLNVFFSCLSARCRATSAWSFSWAHAKPSQVAWKKKKTFRDSETLIYNSQQIKGSHLLSTSKEWSRIGQQ